MMNQAKFIQTSKQVKPVGGVTDDGNGVVIVNLRPQVQITHSYKKNDQMQIIFIEDQTHFEIPSQKELEELYKIHLGCTNFIQPARKYCDDKLQKI